MDPGGSAGGFGVYWDRPLDVPGSFSTIAPLPGLYSVGGAMAATGRALDWFRLDILGGAVTTETLIEEAGTIPPGAEGVVFLPYLAGERSPLWDPTARGAFVGLDARRTAAAHLTGRSSRRRRSRSATSPKPILAAGVEVRAMRVCGGPARSETWNQIKADVTGFTVEVPAVLETAVAGAAIVAATAVGAWPDLPAAIRAMTADRPPARAAAASAAPATTPRTRPTGAPSGDRADHPRPGGDAADRVAARRGRPRPARAPRTFASRSAAVGGAAPTVALDGRRPRRRAGRDRRPDRAERLRQVDAAARRGRPPRAGPGAVDDRRRADHGAGSRGSGSSSRSRASSRGARRRERRLAARAGRLAGRASAPRGSPSCSARRARGAAGLRPVAALRRHAPARGDRPGARARARASCSSTSRSARSTR